MLQYPPVRSQKCSTRCYLRFTNLTERSINVVWVNFSGQYVSYKILHRGQFVDVNTFKTHPWIAIDNNTKDKMHLNKNFVYDPQTFREHFTANFPQYRLREGVESRIIVAITLPMNSLKYTVLLYLKNYFKDTHPVDKLDLPNFLADALKAHILERNNLNTLPLFRVPSSNPSVSGNNR